MFNFDIGNRNNSRGFTLIELLVVIAIISLLSSVVLSSLNSARDKARDARRMADMRQIQVALDMYYDKYGNYPDASSGNGSWERSFEDGGAFIELLVVEGFLPNYVVDPINTQIGNYYYLYYQYSAGNYNCDASKGRFYVLGIRNMDTVPDTLDSSHPLSPGWSCPNNRDWETDSYGEGMDWVTGRFER